MRSHPAGGPPNPEKFQQLASKERVPQVPDRFLSTLHIKCWLVSLGLCQHFLHQRLSMIWKRTSLSRSLSPPPTAAGKRGAICLHQRTDRGRRRSSSEVNGGAPLTRRRSIFNLFHAKLPSITGLSRRAARLALRWRRSCVVVGGGPDSRIPPPRPPSPQNC